MICTLDHVVFRVALGGWNSPSCSVGVHLLRVNERIGVCVKQSLAMCRDTKYGASQASSPPRGQWMDVSECRETISKESCLPFHIPEREYIVRCELCGVQSVMQGN